MGFLFEYINPVEIAADKLSALSWRLLDEEERQDKTLIRHVHDLAALETLITPVKEFPNLVLQSIAGDQNRSGIPQEERLRGILTNLQTSAWKEAYQAFVQDMSFARDDEIIPNEKALQGCERLIQLIDR